MATLLGRWTHRFIDGDPPVDIELRPFTLADYLSVEREREGEAFSDASAMRYMTAAISRCIRSVRGLTVEESEDDIRLLSWPAHTDEILDVLMGYPEEWGRLVMAFQERRKRAEGKC